jgi:hypothetical protein
MKTLLTVVAGLALVVSTSAIAQTADDAAVEQAALAAIAATPVTADAAVTTTVLAPLADLAPATAPAIIASMIVPSPVQTGVPCFSCAPSPTPLTDSLGLSVPYAYIPTTFTTVQYTLEWTDLSYSGSCTVSFALMQGTTKLDSASGTVTGAVPSSIGASAFTRTRKAKDHGAATLVGKVKCGTNTATVKSSVYLQ